MAVDGRSAGREKDLRGEDGSIVVSEAVEEEKRVPAARWECLCIV